MKEIDLTQGQKTIIDDQDYDLVKGIRWYALRHTNPPHSFYVVAKSGTIRMHRLIMGITDSKIQVDHINGNTLDNRRCNLRIASHNQNTKNAKLNSRSTSGYKGVSFRNGKWVSQIQVNKVKMHLGHFIDKKEAAKAYNIAALAHFGEFAKLNQIDD